jgi:16S rRNA (guanine527-N7)-methyltransferase
VRLDLADRLHRGLEWAGPAAALSEQKIEACLNFLEHLYRWNRVHSLTAVPSLEAAVDRHLVDALRAWPRLNEALSGAQGRPRILDIGAGTGVPGIPLAIVLEDTEWILVERVARKAAFLRQAIARLGLADRVRVAQSDVRNLHVDSGCEIILSRAFAALPRFVDWTFHLSNARTQWGYLAGRLENIEGLASAVDVESGRAVEIALLPNRPVFWVQVQALGASNERHLVWVGQIKNGSLG